MSEKELRKTGQLRGALSDALGERVDTPPPAETEVRPQPRVSREDPQLRYARQTRNAAVFVAVVTAVIVVLGLIGMIATLAAISGLGTATY